VQKEIKQLKELLIRKDLEKMVHDSYLEVADENLGYKDVEELINTKIERINQV